MSLMTNLITSTWVPIRRSATSPIELIRPSQISDPSIIALAAPRADFNAALAEFLIALLTTCTTPADEEAWRAWWTTPPSPDVLETAFRRYAHAFEIDGNGARFMQAAVDAEAEPIEGILIDNPGEKAVSDNADMLNRGGRLTALSPAMAALALYTL